MSLRTRLIIAFLILSVVPLSAVTLIWYISSVRTFERAAEREASETASDIGRRMEMVTATVGRRMDRLFDESVSYDGQPQATAGRKMEDRLEPVFGETAALLDRLEFEPTNGEQLRRRYSARRSLAGAAARARAAGSPASTSPAKAAEDRRRCAEDRRGSAARGS